MRAGVAIDGLNCVRKHLSQIKGGRLAAASARTLTFAISDVHGPIPDDPSVIGSGPTVADPTTFAEALEIVAALPEFRSSVRRHLERGARGEVPETVKPGDRDCAQTAYEVIGNASTALEGAARLRRALGYAVCVIEAPIEGEARLAAPQFLARARRLAAQSAGPALRARRRGNDGDRQGRRSRRPQPGIRPAAGAGDGGRAASFGALRAQAPMASTVPQMPPAPWSTRRRSSGRSARVSSWESTLAANDAYHFFQPLGDLVMWGPTGTNVGDVQMLLVP